LSFAEEMVSVLLLLSVLQASSLQGMAPVAQQDQLLADEGVQWPDSPTEDST